MITIVVGFGCFLLGFMICAIFTSSRAKEQQAAHQAAFMSAWESDDFDIGWILTGVEYDRIALKYGPGILEEMMPILKDVGKVADEWHEAIAEDV